MNKESGKEHDQKPDPYGVNNTDGSEKTDAAADSVIFLSAVIITQNRLSSAGNAADRHRDDFPNRIDNGHNTDIEITTECGKAGITGNRHSTVGAGHGKTGNTEGNNFFENRKIDFQIGAAKF